MHKLLPILIISLLHLTACRSECKREHTGYTKPPAELSATAKFVQSLEPVVDHRYSKPLCFLAREYGSYGAVAVLVSCATFKNDKRANPHRIYATKKPQRLLPNEAHPDAGITDAEQE